MLENVSMNWLCNHFSYPLCRTPVKWRKLFCKYRNWSGACLGKRKLSGKDARVSVAAILGCWVSAVTRCPPSLTHKLQLLLSDALWWLQRHRKDLEAQISQHVSRHRKTMAPPLALFHIEKLSRESMVVHIFNPSTCKQGRRTMSSRLLWAA